MSKKDYIVVAQVFQDTRPPGNSPEWELWRQVRDAMARELNATNLHFDRARFEEWTER
jgi:hypothetical protein